MAYHQRPRFGEYPGSYSSGNSDPALFGPSFNAEEIKSWCEDLQRQWQMYKKDEQFFNMVHTKLESSSNPFLESLMICRSCKDFGIPGRITLAHDVMMTFKFWLDDNKRAYQCLNQEAKLAACKVIPYCNDSTMAMTIFNTYSIREEPHLIKNVVDQELMRKKYKEACHLAAMGQIHAFYTVEQLVIPLILQDKVNVAEAFLDGSTDHQRELVVMLDNILGLNDISQLHQLGLSLEVPSMKLNNINPMTFKKLVSRLSKKYKLGDFCPNLNKKNKKGALYFMLKKRYIEKSIGEESWQEMAHEAVKESLELQIELIKGVHGYGANHDVVFWVNRYGIAVTDLPEHVQSTIDLSSPSASEPVAESSHQDGRYLPFSLPKSSIIIIDTPELLSHFINVVLEDVTMVGVDAEWKPSFGGKPPELALLQIGLADSVYLLDIAVMKGKLSDTLMNQLGSKFFFEQSILKLGFGLGHDLRAVQSALPQIGGHLSMNVGGYLDLQTLWHILLSMHNISLPFQPGQDGRQGLSSLVQQCLGLPLNKDNQFSNWERRPLRENQIIYAALDAHCLLQIYDVLETSCKEQNIAFEEACREAVPFIQRPTSHKKMESPVAVAPFPSPLPGRQKLMAKDAKMLCDTMVQGLGKYLRKLGIDTKLVSNPVQHSYCVRVAQMEGRFIITRGKSYQEFASQLPEGQVINISSQYVEEQVDEVLKFFNIQVSQNDIFARCMGCNGGVFIELTCNQITSLIEADVKELDGVPVKHQKIPRPLLTKVELFRVCKGCGHCYWDGSHIERFLRSKVALKVLPSD